MPASTSTHTESEGIDVGSVLDGRYRIDALIGTGGMGRVFRGEHTGIGRAVAIKVLHTDLNRNREASARFQREALASGRLDHPNIVGVSDFGVLADGACYLVMEVLEGETLGERLQRERRVPWREALDILRGVLTGLRHAHERGVVHRDIKPDNIYLARKDGDLIIKILDFGIAKLRAGSPDDPAATRAGLTVGTPAYLSPEQAVGGEITPASDLYSATVVLFEMLAGRAPFEDKDPLAMLGAHVSRPPPRIADVAPEVSLPGGFEDVIQRGLAKSPTERFTVANDYLAALDQMLHARSSRTHLLAPVEVIPVSHSSSSLPVAMPTPPPLPVAHDASSPNDASLTQLPPATRAVTLPETEPIPRRWIWTGGLVLLVLILLAIIVGMATRGGGDKPDKPDKKSEAADPGKPAAGAEAAKKDEAATVEKQPVHDEAALKAAVGELQKGKTCDLRKAAVKKLAALGNPAAIEPLEKAKWLPDGGFLNTGLRKANLNWCLVADAEAAIQKLRAQRPTGT